MRNLHSTDYTHGLFHVKDAITNYLAAHQKLAVLYSGPLKQDLPDVIPARQYMSTNKANALNLPYSTREAKMKFERMEKNALMYWEPEDKTHSEKMKECKKMLETGKKAFKPWTY